MLHTKPGDILVWNSTVVAHASARDPHKDREDNETVPQDTARLTFDMRCVCVPQMRDLVADKNPKLAGDGRSFCRERWEYNNHSAPLTWKLNSGFGNPDNDTKGDWCVLRRQHGPGDKFNKRMRYARRRQ